MTSIIEKRVSLHRRLASEQQQISALKAQASHLQALANIGTATCMIAHEVNNLLLPLGNYAALALSNPDDKLLIEKALQKTVRISERASKIMESMLAVANSEVQERRETPLIILVEEVFNCLCRDFAKDKITVNLKVPDHLTVWAVPVQIQQVLMNLILNARDSMLPAGGILTIEAREIADAVKIRVSDTGYGIERDKLEKIFEPLFTTKRDEKSSSQNSSSGLGLAFCKQIVDAHGGCISVESKPNEGSTFKISLPKRRSR
ncbi:MAG: sensor histidine kinase [Planctomycetota bacterium]